MAFEELKARQSGVWGEGAFERVSATAAEIHDAVVEALQPRPGERWLDVASGTGPVAERAARAGALVTGVDLAPALVEKARRSAREQGLDIDYRVGDAESLPVEDASYDVVSSTFGVMFAPDQARAAAELARAARPGGRLGVTGWTPDGGVGRMLQITSRFQPPQPEGAGLPLDWGRQGRVEELLGEAFDLRFEQRTSTHTVGSGEEYWQFMVTGFGPLKVLAGSLDAERGEELHRAWVDFFEANFRMNGAIEHRREYLLVLGRRR